MTNIEEKYNFDGKDYTKPGFEGIPMQAKGRLGPQASTVFFQGPYNYIHD